MRIILASLLSCAAVSACLHRAPAAVDVPFRPLDAGIALQYGPRGSLVFQDSETWQRFWQANCAAADAQGRALAAPEIDFARRTLLAVFAGRKPTGGYAIDVTGVKKTDGKLVVSVREQSPSPDAMVIQVLTFPYRLVLIEKTNLPIEFTYPK